MTAKTIVSAAKAYATTIASCSVLTLVSAYQAYMNALHYTGPASYSEFLPAAAQRFFCYALLIPPLFWAVKKWPISAQRLAIRLPLYLAFAAAFVCLASTIRWSLFPIYAAGLRRSPPRTLALLAEIIRTNLIPNTCYMFVPLVAIVHAVQFRAAHRQQELAYAELRRNLAERRLHVLKMNLQPHFLFNTLQGIGTLIRRDSAGASAMLRGLTELLQSSLEYEERDVVRLQEELGFLNSYLAIERVRLQERLKVEFRCSPDALQCVVPHMLLQPLLENAVKHGVERSREGGWISVEGNVKHRKLHLRIRNSLKPAATHVRGGGVGLKNSRLRLQSLYGGEAFLELHFPKPDEAEVLVALPAVLRERINTQDENEF